MISAGCEVSGATEGTIDEAVLGRIVAYSGAHLGRRFGRQGKSRLLQDLPGYNAAAAHAPWVVLVDLNGSPDCAPVLVRASLPAANRYMAFRVAVREVEAWLLADAARLAAFLGVSPSRVPPDPDVIADPKNALVELARRSPRRAVREDMVPAFGSGRAVGPAYTSRLIEFVSKDDGWRPDVAADASESLRRCIAAVQRLVRDACNHTS